MRLPRWTCVALVAVSLVCATATALAAPKRQSRIGAGRGFFTYRLAKAVGEKGKVFATEISAKAIKSVVDRIKRDNIKNIEPVISEPTKTKLADNSLDAAVICLVLHHVPKDLRTDLVKDICRAIKPGGYFYIIDWRLNATIPYDKGRRIPKAELIKLGTDAGMSLDAEFHYLQHQVFLRLRKPVKTK